MAAGLLVAETVGRRHRGVLGAVLEEQRGGCRVTDVVDRLDGPHRLQPGILLGLGDAVEVVGSLVFGSGHVGDQAPVADPEHVGPQTRFDPGQETPHGAAVADPEVPHPPAVDLGPGLQHVDGPAQVHDQLDLFLPVLPREHQRAAAGPPRPGEGSVDGDRHRPGPGQGGGQLGHLPAVRRQTVHQHQAGEGAFPVGDEQGGGDPAAPGAGVGQVEGGDVPGSAGSGLLDVERGPGVVVEEVAVLSVQLGGVDDGAGRWHPLVHHLGRSRRGAPTPSHRRGGNQEREGQPRSHAAPPPRPCAFLPGLLSTVTGHRRLA